MKTNLMHYLSSVYFFNQPRHVSSISVADHQEEFCIYTTIGTCCIYTVCLLMMGYRYARNMSRLIEEINCIKLVFTTNGCIDMHCQQNIKSFHRVYYQVIFSGKEMSVYLQKNIKYEHVDAVCAKRRTFSRYKWRYIQVVAELQTEYPVNA
jgi:hypothetical protein